MVSIKKIQFYRAGKGVVESAVSQYGEGSIFNTLAIIADTTSDFPVVNHIDDIVESFSQKEVANEEEVMLRSKIKDFKEKMGDCYFIALNDSDFYNNDKEEFYIVANSKDEAIIKYMTEGTQCERFNKMGYKLLKAYDFEDNLLYDVESGINAFLGG